MQITLLDIVRFSFEYITTQESEYEDKKSDLEKANALDLFMFIASKEYDKLDDHEKEKHDKVFDYLIKYLFVVSDTTKEYRIEDPLFVLYCNSTSQTKRDRLLKKITSDIKQLSDLVEIEKLMY